MANTSTSIVQPPFHKKILTVKNPVAAGSINIRRGYMLQAQPYASGQAQPLRFNYLYNPSTVQAEYNMQVTNASLANQYLTTADQGQLKAPTNNTSSWTVMFDRTYELWGSYDSKGNCLYDNNAWGNDPRVVGVWADILQLQWFTGMWTEAEGVGLHAVSDGAVLYNSVNQTGPYIPTGPMLLQMSWAFFGTNVGGFYGAITEWDYTITHYNQFMIPMRCVIDINFMMFPNPGGNKSKTGATTINNTALGYTGNHYYQPTSGGYVGGSN